MAAKLFGIVILSVASVLFGCAAISAVREGHAWGFVFPGDRTRSPILFWSCVAGCAGMAVAILGAGIVFALQPISG
jgi:hypothetical protein